MANYPRSANAAGATTSVDKAFDVCEALSLEPGGMSLSDLSRTLKQPRPSVHRLLTVLKRRGYVRQDEETQRYSLGMKTLDLSFRMLGRSELRMHAYPVLRTTRRSPDATFLAVPPAGEVTYISRGGAGDVAMSAGVREEMPAHCVHCLSDAGTPARPAPQLPAARRGARRDARRGARAPRRRAGDGTGGGGRPRVCCTCAPVFDYSGREVARIGVFGQGADDRAIAGVHNRGAWELARHVSMRLGYLSAVAMGVR